MSLIHLEKSVLSFHFREIIEDGHGNHPLTWVGLGVLVLGPKILPAITKTSQSRAKVLAQPQLSRSRHREIPLSQWISEARERELSNSINHILPSKSGSLHKATTGEFSVSN